MAILCCPTFLTVVNCVVYLFIHKGPWKKRDDGYSLEVGNEDREFSCEHVAAMFSSLCMLQSLRKAILYLISGYIFPFLLCFGKIKNIETGIWRQVVLLLPAWDTCPPTLGPGSLSSAFCYTRNFSAERVVGMALASEIMTVEEDSSSTLCITQEQDCGRKTGTVLTGSRSEQCSTLAAFCNPLRSF